MQRLYFLPVLVAMMCMQPVRAQLYFTPFKTGLGSPIDLKHAGDSRLFIADQLGSILLLDSLGNMAPLPFLNITDRVKSGGEQGLLGIAFDPGFKTNGRFYVNYTRNPGGATVISRFRLTGDSAHCDSTTEQVLLTIFQPYSNHNGGNIMFGPDGYLYIGMGDGGSGGDPQRRSQNVDSLLGKMLRIDVSDTTVAYKIPGDNPYVGKPGRDEIWALGLRNPWRWSFDRLNNDLWLGDVGQNTREELNHVNNNPPGINYGWRCYEGPGIYDTTGCPPASSMTFPVFSYPITSTNKSICGGYVYRGSKYASLWGKYIFSDVYSGTLRTMTEVAPDSFVHALHPAADLTNIVSFGENVYGELFAVSQSGKAIFRIHDSSCAPVAFIQGPSSVQACDSVVLRAWAGPGLTCQWNLNGTPISGATASSFAVRTGGSYTVQVSAGSAPCTSVSNPVVVSFPAAVTLVLPQDTVCIQGGAITLSGIPSGGVFSGGGVTGNLFSPAAAGAGYHVLTYTRMDSVFGCTESDQDSIFVDVCTGLAELSAPDAMSIHPNPTRSDFSVSFHVPVAQPVSVTITSLLGQRIAVLNHSASAGVNNIPVALELDRGIYFVSLQGTNGSQVKRVVIQR